MPGFEDFEGTTAVVTGGGSGIGAGLCRRFAHERMNVVVSDVDADSAEKTAEALRAGGSQAIAIECDVSQRSAVEELAEQAIAHFGRVDVVCNNAGVFLGGEMRDFTTGDWEWVMSVNLMGVVNGCSVFARHLVEQGSGQIVNTASIGGFISDPRSAPYTTSKFAVVGFSEALRADLEPDGIGVTLLCPGPVATGLPRSDRLRPAGAGPSAATSEALTPLIVQGMPPDEVAGRLMKGIRENAAYVFTHPELAPIFEPRIQAIRDALAATPTPAGGAVVPEDFD